VTKRNSTGWAAYRRLVAAGIPTTAQERPERKATADNAGNSADR
jgi:hypothetical protein